MLVTLYNIVLQAIYKHFLKIPMFLTMQTKGFSGFQHNHEGYLHKYWMAVLLIKTM